ncbi:bifunctional glyoxylate/hydroxypyruvate reductase B [Gracilibacillus salitolerans]|uniref:Bifunctional glyoxylate/hydroxypyruvate reductase B n=1 Tax=Gracilibacillus salitolerans TaxID=2663022 RepID=A0A5Q2TK87_9BACI|nr:D-glycerate dehydrogenase [Gracilibacillus salitolerans]QGH34300.1 bifunctional glyoxylate/hydroxypyruvate reductase B [Gracilibacillus salitolerans]
MRKKVLVTEPIPETVKNYLQEHVELTTWDNPEQMPREQLLNTIGSFHGLITAKDSIDDELLQHAEQLEVVSNISVGYDNFDVNALKRSQVIATHTPYVLDETVADLIFGLILSSARRITELDQFTKQGKWEKAVDAPLFGHNVHHKKLGIIGMGRIGEKVARRAKLGFEMDVTYYNRSRKEKVEKELGLAYQDFDTLLKESDFILLMTPLTKETLHLIDVKAFGKMKDSCFFINASRGKVVDEAAMIKALQDKEIAGAGLDVFEQEPIDPDNPLLKMDNVVTLPHIGSATAETREEMKFFAAENMLQGLDGEQPEAVIKELQ